MKRAFAVAAIALLAVWQPARVLADQPVLVAPLSNALHEVEAPVIIRPALQPRPWAAAPVLARDVPLPQISALAAVVVDEASAAVLYDGDAHVPLPPASLTKIATAILALERGKLDAEVVSDVNSREMPRSSVMGLLPGDVFTLDDLLHGLMLPSGNDAALAIARHISGSDAAFVREMNALAWRMGLAESSWANPHGLGASTHVASAYDLAMYARYAMQVPGFNELVNARSWVAKGSRTLELGNINTFLGRYSGADGIKTGYTRRAGHTLVASATRNGHRLYAVVLNAPERDADARKLLDWAFASYAWTSQ